MKSGGDLSVEKKKYSGEGGQTVKNMDSPDNILDAQRREKVKDAMLHAWSSYEKYAWGHDELQVCDVTSNKLFFKLLMLPFFGCILRFHNQIIGGGIKKGSRCTKLLLGAGPRKEILKNCSC